MIRKCLASLCDSLSAALWAVARLHSACGRLSEGGGPQGRRECPKNDTTLPQSKIGCKEPIFDSPLREGAKKQVLYSALVVTEIIVFAMSLNTL